MNEEEKVKQPATPIYDDFDIDNLWAVKPALKPIEENPKKKKKVFFVGENVEAQLNSWLENFELVTDMKYCDIVIFGHGPFLNSEIWGRKMFIARDTKYEINDERDISDIKAFAMASKYGKYIIGIGRGAHLCAVLSGAEVVQFVKHPNSVDSFFMDKHEHCYAPFNQSTNRMIQYPYVLKTGFIPILLSNMNSPVHHFDNTGSKSSGADVFMCYYNNTNSLAIDLYPWNGNSEYIKHCNRIIDILYNGKIVSTFNPSDNYEEDSYETWDLEEFDYLFDFNDEGIRCDDDGEPLSDEEIDQRVEIEVDRLNRDKIAKKLKEKITSKKPSIEWVTLGTTTTTTI